MTQLATGYWCQDHQVSSSHVSANQSSVCLNLTNYRMAAAVESLKPPPPSPPVSPYCVELPEDVVEKIAELDLELSEGDITQKGYEKKKTKLLAPFLRENITPSKKTVEPERNGARPELRIAAQSNGSSVSRIPVPISSSQTSSQPSSSSSSTAAQAPSAPPAESPLTTSGASGLSDSSGQ